MDSKQPMHARAAAQQGVSALAQICRQPPSQPQQFGPALAAIVSAAAAAPAAAEAVASALARQAAAASSSCDVDRLLEAALRVAAAAERAASPAAAAAVARIVAGCCYALSQQQQLKRQRQQQQQQLLPTLHPLAELLSVCPSAWETLLSRALPATIADAQPSAADSAAFAAFLWPFLRSALLKQQQQQQSTALSGLFRTRLHAFAVDLARRCGAGCALGANLAALLPLYAVSGGDADTREQAASAANDLADFVASKEGRPLAPVVVDALLSLLSGTSGKNVPLWRFLSALERICACSITEETGGSGSSASLVSFLAFLLHAAPEDEQLVIMQILLHVLQKKNHCAFSLALLREALVEVQCSAVGEAAASDARKLSAELANVAASLAPSQHRQQCCKDCAPTDRPRSPALLHMETLRRDMCALWMEEQDGIAALKRLLDKFPSSAHVSDAVVFFLRPFARHPSLSLRLCAMDALFALASKDALAAFACLPTLLSILSDPQEQPEALAKALEIIPALASCKANIATMLRALTPLLKQDEKVFPTALRALLSMWKHESRVFSFLREHLQAFKPEMPLESRISIALSVKEVCLIDIDRGLDLLHVIWAILQNEHHHAPLCFALDSLETLCSSGAVSFSSVWTEVVSRRLDGTSDSRVLGALVRLLGCASIRANELAAAKEDAHDAEPTDEATKKQLEFANEIASKLFAFSNHESPDVRASALASLARFPISLLELLPIDAEKTRAMCADQDSSVRKEAVSLLGKLCSEETGFRGPLVQAPQSSTQTQREIAGIPKTIREQFGSEIHVGAARAAIAGAMLWAFSPASRASEEKTSEFWSTLELLLSTVEATDWITRMLALSGLTSFMSKFADVAICGAKGNEQSVAASVVQRVLSLCELQRQESPAKAEFCAFALGALSLALPASSRAQAAVISQALRGMINEGAETQALCGCRAAIACSEAVSSAGTNGSSALLGELSQLVATGDEWERFGCALGIAVIAPKLPESQLQTLLGLQAQLLGVLKTNEPEWWAFGVAIALASTSVELLQRGNASAPLGALETLTSELARFVESGGEGCTARQATAPVALSPIIAALFRTGKLQPSECAKAVSSIRAAALIDGAGSQFKSAAFVALGSLVNALVAAGMAWTAWPELQDALRTVSEKCSPEGDIPQSLSFGSFLAAANLLGSDVVVCCASSPWPFSHPTDLSHAAATDRAFDSAVSDLAAPLRAWLDSDRVGMWKATAWALGTLCRSLPQSKTMAASRVDTAFEGMAQCKICHDIVAECAQSKPSAQSSVACETALKSLTAASRLPLVPWAPLINSVVKSGLGDSVVSACVTFVQSRIERWAGGAAAKSVAVACSPLLCSWLEPTVLMSFSESVRCSMVASLASLADFSDADLHRCSLKLLSPRVFASLFLSDNSKMAASFAVPFLERVSLIGKASKTEDSLPTQMLNDLASAVARLFAGLPSPVAFVQGSSVPRVNAELERTVSSVALCLSKLEKRFALRSTKSSSGSKPLPAALKQPLSSSPQDISACTRSVLAACSLLELGAIKASELTPCRRWCVSADPRMAQLHAAAVLCSAKLSEAAGKSSANEVQWANDSLDLLLSSQCTSKLAAMVFFDAEFWKRDVFCACLVSASHERRLLIAALAGRSADPALCGYSPLAISQSLPLQALLDRLHAQHFNLSWADPLAQLFLTALVGPLCQHAAVLI